jgi:large subunit ribosomal protein L15
MKQLKLPENSRRSKKILGRGESSGKGRTCARGQKGAKARAGSTIKLGYEGGQIALIRSLPKFGFSNEPHRKKYVTLTLKDIERISKSVSDISLKTLCENKIISKNVKLVKILGSKDFSAKVNISEDVSITSKAKEQVVAAGGNVADKPAPKKLVKFEKKKK